MTGRESSPPPPPPPSPPPSPPSSPDPSSGPSPLPDDIPSIETVETLGRSDLAGQTTDEGRGRIFPCEQCGADLEFHIGQQKLKCPFCGHEREIVLDPQAGIRENDYREMLERLRQRRASGVELQIEGLSEVRCESCGGTVEFTGTLTSTKCPYCASPIQREKVHTATQRVPVDAVLPFFIDHRQARANLTAWMKSRWFAPNDFISQAVHGDFQGVYLPYWTFDTATFNAYSGQRGENYRVTVGTGKNRRTETRTRWYPASGRFQRFFDDVLVIGSEGLPREFLQELEPWPLRDCMPFTQQILAGHIARTYDVELDRAFLLARERIDAAIEREVRRRIGGDKQRISNIKTRCDAITFKHLLLPVWLMPFRYHGHVYQVFINARTGKVQGQRPYSWIKITLAVLAALVVGLTVAALAAR